MIQIIVLKQKDRDTHFHVHKAQDAILKFGAKK